MLNAGGLDPTGRNYAQYAASHAQAGNPGLSYLGNILPGAGLQGALGGRPPLVPLTSAAPQQAGQGHFGNANNLQAGLPQLAQYGPAGGRGLPHQLVNGLGNNVNAATAAAYRGTIGALGNPLAAQVRQPQMDRGGGAAGLGMGNAGLNMQFNNLQRQQMLNPLNANALTNLQAQAAANRTMQIQQQLQQHANPQQIQPSHDLLAMFKNQQQMPRPSTAGAFGANHVPGMGAFGGAASVQQGLGTGLQPQGNQQPQEHEQPAFDSSDFPSLTRPKSRADVGPYAGVAGEAYSQLNLKRGANTEFNMQSEDFPALQASQATQQQADDRLFGANNQQAALQKAALQRLANLGQQAHDPSMVDAGGRHVGNFGGADGGGNYDQLHLLQQKQAGMAANKGAPLLPEKANAGLHGGNSSPPNYGLLGLLGVIRMTDHDLTMLALGTDLTGLGLNLNSPDSLYKTFVSPLADNPVRAEPEFQVPACYKHAAPRLLPGHLSKFKEDTLFYIFYSMPQDEAQLIAADELYHRGWWYHKKLKMWLIHAPSSNVTKTPRGERGTYLFFDTGTWDYQQRQDMEICYDDLEVPTKVRRVHVPARPT